MVAIEDQLKARSAESPLQRRQEWFVGVGLLLLILGAFAGADLFAAAAATMVSVGTLMAAAATLGLAHARQQKSTSDFPYWIAPAVAYAIVAALTLANSTLATAMATALLGSALTLSGSARLLLSLRLRANEGWVWLAVSGATSLLAGSTFLLGTAGDELWTLGAILSFDLAFQGCALIALGLAFAA